MHKTGFHGFIGALLLGGCLALTAGCAAKDASPAGTPAQPEAPSEDSADGADASDPMALEQAAYEQARPVFEKYCAGCHTTENAHGHGDALEHFSMDGYPFGGDHAHEIGHEIREVLGAEGDEATMPPNEPGVVQGEELALVLAWADAFDEAQAARGDSTEAHGHDEGHGHGESHGHGEAHGHGEGHGHGEAHGHGHGEGHGHGDDGMEE